jgi:hypothetical protein
LAVLTFAAGRQADAITLDKFFYTYPQPGILFGTFTGTVEPDGFIQLADLTDIDVMSNIFFGALTRANFSLFSFNTTGGSSSLDFIASDPTIPVLACAGASIALFAPCNAFGRDPTDATATVFTFEPLFIFDIPTITLASSTPIPEPPTWAMLLAGVAGIALARIASRGRGARVVAGQA